jgi:hypothetical protein
MQVAHQYHGEIGKLRLCLAEADIGAAARIDENLRLIADPEQIAGFARSLTKPGAPEPNTCTATGLPMQLCASAPEDAIRATATAEINDRNMSHLPSLSLWNCLCGELCTYDMRRSYNSGPATARIFFFAGKGQVWNPPPRNRPEEPRSCIAAPGKSH